MGKPLLIGSNLEQRTIKRGGLNAVSAEAHAVLDYVMVGSSFMSALWFWRKSKRAAVAALISGGAGLAVTLLTDYPGGVMKIISLRKHREIDFGLGAMTATLPEFLAFQDEPEKKFFLIQGAMISVLSELTTVPGRGVRAEIRYDGMAEFRYYSGRRFGKHSCGSIQQPVGMLTMKKLSLISLALSVLFVLAHVSLAADETTVKGYVADSKCAALKESDPKTANSLTRH